MPEYFDLDSIKKERDDAARRKMILGVVGSIGDSLANRPTAAHMYLNRKINDPTSGNIAKAISSQIKDPMESTLEEFKVKQVNDSLAGQDPESEKSKRYTKSLTGIFPKLGPKIEGMSYEEAQKFAPMLTQKLRDQANFKQQIQLEQMRRDTKLQDEVRKKMEEEAKANRPKTFKEVVSKLGGESRKRLDNIRMGRDAIQKMAKALKGGDNTFSLKGDNRFTFASLLWKEAVGRMQSGGAINDDEAKSFRALAPGVMDTKEMQAVKLRTLATEMDRRLEGFGLDAGSVPNYIDPSFDDNINSYAGKTSKDKSFSPGIDRANAASYRQAPKGKITVTDGSRTVYIDPSDLEDALKDGFRKVD